MDKYSERKRAESTQKNKPIPPIPDQCGNCKADAVVIFIRVINEYNGIREAGFFSGSYYHRPYGYLDHRTGDVQMAQGYIFDGWIARCASCYTADCIHDMELKKQQSLELEHEI